jgi:EAL domain-containing protein (putative c-di-GMP-specific phosphodiesterase class I)
LPARLFRVHRERDTLTATDLACLERCLPAIARLGAGRQAHLNIFPSTLLEVEPDSLAARLERADDPRRICLELNEQMLVGDPAELVERVRALRKRVGCKVAIDDVGYGRSSLEALIVLEPDVVKIDRRFVHGVAGSVRARRVLERLVGTARALEATVVAEGVERAADAEVLRDIGVPFAQGYLFGRPSADGALRRASG